MIACPQCLAAGIAASINGPTCSHPGPAGDAWFPKDWDERGLEARIQYLNANQPPPKQLTIELE